MTFKKGFAVMPLPLKASECSFHDIQKLVHEAIDDLQNDRLLFHNHASERSITHRLAVYLEKRFDGWNVDCEYNRIEDDKSQYKYLFLDPDDNGHVSVFSLDGSRVFPDIVIHHRGDNGPDDNLLVIEVKVPWSQVNDSRDIRKLRAFTGHAQSSQIVTYQFGLFIRFGGDGRIAGSEQFERPAMK